MCDIYLCIYLLCLLSCYAKWETVALTHCLLCGFVFLAIHAAASAPCLCVVCIHVLVLLIIPQAPLQLGLHGWKEKPAGFLFVFSLCAFPQPSAASVDVATHSWKGVESGLFSHSLCPPLPPCQGAWEAFGIT